MGVGFQPVQPSTAILFWRTSPGLFQTRSNECIWWSHWCFSNTKNKQNIDFSLKPLLVSLVLQQNQTRKNKCFKQKQTSWQFCWRPFVGWWVHVTRTQRWIVTSNVKPCWILSSKTCGHEKRHTVPRSRIAKHGALGGKQKIPGWNRSVSSNLQNFPWMKMDEIWLICNSKGPGLF